MKTLDTFTAIYIITEIMEKQIDELETCIYSPRVPDKLKDCFDKFQENFNDMIVFRNEVKQRDIENEK